MKRWLFAPLALLLAAGAAAWQSGGAPDTDQITGRVVAVSDGDTLTLLTPEQRQVKVRLDQIDAPETGQPWGRNAKQSLSDRVYARTVLVRTSGTDRYGRTLGRVSAGGEDVNAALVRDGSAWAYRQYLTDPGLLALERDARASERGLWSLPDNQVTPPWEWRVAQRSDDAPPRSTPLPRRPESASSAGSCGAKRYCSQMSSCADARRHLTQCGVSSLDGDGDGMPCEKLCNARG